MRAPLVLAACLTIAALLPQSSGAQNDTSPSSPEQDDPTRPTNYFDLRNRF